MSRRRAGYDDGGCTCDEVGRSHHSDQAMTELEANTTEGDEAQPRTSDLEPGASPGSAGSPGSPGLAARLGLAILHPRWALTVAADRRHAGRSGTDLIAAIVLLLAATQLRRLATAIWLGGAVEPGLGVRAVTHVLSGALTVTLGLLLLGAGVGFALAGPRRNLG